MCLHEFCLPLNSLIHPLTQPVNMYPPSSMGLHDVYGNVWEWTEDHFNGLPGFKTTFLYDDFSSPCFDGRHTMMMVRYALVVYSIDTVIVGMAN